jgi:hypothetical protein
MQGPEFASKFWAIKNLFLRQLGVLSEKGRSLFLKKIKKGMGLN